MFKLLFGSTIVQVMARLSGVITNIVLTRVLGAENYGYYGLFLSLVAVASLPVAAGLPQLLTRETSKSKTDDNWASIKCIFLWGIEYVIKGTLVIFPIAFSLFFIVRDPNLTLGIFLCLVLIIPIRGGQSIYVGILSGLNQPVTSQFILNVATPLLFVSLCLFLWFTEYDASLSTIFSAQILTSLLSIFIFHSYLHKSVPERFWRLEAIKNKPELNKNILPFTLTAIIATFNSELATIILGVYSDAKDIACFRVAFLGVNIVGIGLIAVNVVVAPKFVNLYKLEKKKELQSLISSSVRVSFLISFPLLLLLSLNSEFILTFLFGAEYAPAALLVKILCLGQLVNIVSGSVGIILVMVGHEKMLTKISVIALLVNLAMLTFLVPFFASVGAAIANSVTLTLLNVFALLYLYKKERLKSWLC